MLTLTQLQAALPSLHLEDDGLTLPASPRPTGAAEDEALLVEIPVLKKQHAFSKKHEELRRRVPPARGDAAKMKVGTRHAMADARHSLLIEAKSMMAAKHNDAVDQTVIGSREVKKLARANRKKASEKAMAEAATRHAETLGRVASKGASESRKVATAAAALQQQAAQQAAAQEAAEAAAACRAADQVEKVRAKGTHELDKVATAVAALEDWTVVKARSQEAKIQSAAKRRAAKLEAISAKGTAESRKVDKVCGPRSRHPPLASTLPTSPDSVRCGSSEMCAHAVAASPPPSPKNTASVARETSMLLALMRAGVPNDEVLRARTEADYRAVAARHGIELDDSGRGGAAAGSQSACVPLAGSLPLAAPLASLAGPLTAVDAVVNVIPAMGAPAALAVQCA